MFPYPLQNHSSHRKAFTLIELLAVITILAVLAALIFPVLGRISSNAKAAECLSNLRQIGVIFHSYVQDNNGEMPFAVAPTIGSWDFQLVAYATSREEALRIGQAEGEPHEMFRCPASEKPVRGTAVASSYAINQNLVGTHPSTAEVVPPRRRVISVAKPSQTYLIVDSDGREFWKDTKARFQEVRFGGISAVERHGGQLNMLFLDGSVRPLDFEDMPWGAAYSANRVPWGPEP